MEAAVVFLPLIGAAIAGLFGRQIGDKGAQYVTCALVTLSGVIAWYLFYDIALQGNARTIELATWILVGQFDVSWALKVDQLTAVMLIVVTTVSAVVHWYSIGYMHHDERSEEHTSELQSLMRISYAVFCLKKKK